MCYKSLGSCNSIPKNPTTDCIKNIAYSFANQTACVMNQQLWFYSAATGSEVLAVCDDFHSKSHGHFSPILCTRVNGEIDI